jgi:hypothetical protein
LKQILWRKFSEFSVEEHSLVRTECQEHMLLIFSLCQRKSHSTRTNQMLQLHSERMNHLGFNANHCDFNDQPHKIFLCKCNKNCIQKKNQMHQLHSKG